MANRLFMQDHADSSKLFNFPLTKDPMLEIESQFSSFGEVIPSVNDFLNASTLAMTGAGGQVDAGLLKFKNLFDIKRWTKTDPIRLTVDIQLYTQTNPKEDVYRKAYQLMEYTMLTKDSTGYIVPGMSLASLKDFQTNKEAGVQGTSSKAKLICLWIPGIIYLPRAIIEKVQPTFSREVTESGFPLWAELNLSIESVFPANTEFFDEMLLQGVTSKAGLTNAIAIGIGKTKTIGI